MTDGMITYSLGEGIVAFTTDRTVGRDPEKVTDAVCRRLNAAANGAGSAAGRTCASHGRTRLTVTASCLWRRNTSLCRRQRNVC